MPTNTGKRAVRHAANRSLAIRQLRCKALAKLWQDGLGKETTYLAADPVDLRTFPEPVESNSAVDLEIHLATQA